jgi:hypothetical protein
MRRVCTVTKKFASNNERKMRMKTRGSLLFLVIISLLMAIGISFVGCGNAAAKAKAKSQVQIGKGANNEQTICPITGKPIDKKCFAEQDGKRIYGCSSKCTNTIGGHFGYFVTPMEKAGVVLEKAGGGK